MILAKFDVNKEFEFSGVVSLFNIVKNSNIDFLVSASLTKTGRFSPSGFSDTRMKTSFGYQIQYGQIN